MALSFWLVGTQILPSPVWASGNCSTCFFPPSHSFLMCLHCSLFSWKLKGAFCRSPEVSALSTVSPLLQRVLRGLDMLSGWKTRAVGEIFSFVFFSFLQMLLIAHCWKISWEKQNKPENNEAVCLFQLYGLCIQSRWAGVGTNLPLKPSSVSAKGGEKSTDGQWSYEVTPCPHSVER